MSIKIALAGNPNCGKTTLFNNLTGSNQYVGNWPGVTVEKKEGKLKGDKDVIIQDLPGIYSLSPYTLEEVVSRTYLVKEKPDAILNIIDGTNIERNLYLTTQLIELGIPVVMAVNMIDLVRKNGDKIDLKKLSAELGCQAVEISALKGEGTEAAAKAAVAAAKATKAAELPHVFTGSVEHAIAHIEESIQGKVDDRFLRWYAVKLFERDEKVMDELKLDKSLTDHIDQHIKFAGLSGRHIDKLCRIRSGENDLLIAHVHSLLCFAAAVLPRRTFSFSLCFHYSPRGARVSRRRAQFYCHFRAKNHFLFLKIRIKIAHSPHFRDCGGSSGAVLPRAAV